MVVCMPKPATRVARLRLHVTPCPGDVQGEETRLMAQMQPRRGMRPATCVARQHNPNPSLRGACVMWGLRRAKPLMPATCVAWLLEGERGCYLCGKCSTLSWQRKV